MARAPNGTDYFIDCDVTVRPPEEPICATAQQDGSAARGWFWRRVTGHAALVRSAAVAGGSSARSLGTVRSVRGRSPL